MVLVTDRAGSLHYNLHTTNNPRQRLSDFRHVNSVEVENKYHVYVCTKQDSGAHFKARIVICSTLLFTSVTQMVHSTMHFH
jgi:hypothetical protein